MANTKPTLEEIGRKYGYSANNSNNSKGSQNNSVPTLEEIGKKYGYSTNKSNNGEQSNSVPSLEEIGNKYVIKKPEKTQTPAYTPEQKIEYPTKLEYSTVVKYLKDNGVTGASGIMTKHEWARRKGKDGGTYEGYLRNKIYEAQTGKNINSLFYIPLSTPATQLKKQNVGPVYNPQMSVSSDEYAKKSANLEDLQNEIESLEDIVAKANKYENDIKIYTNRANTSKHRGNGLTASSAYDKKIKDTEAEYKKFLLDNGFKNINDLKNKIAEKRQYKSSAKYIQDRASLENNIRAEADFNEYVVKGEALGNEKRDGWLVPDNDRKNPVAYFRNNPEAMKEYEDVLDSIGGSAERIVKEGALGYKLAKYGTKEQIETYYAYLGKGDEESANKYLEYIKESLNIAASKDIAKEQDNFFKKMNFGATVGFDKFEQGAMNLFNTSDDYIPRSAVQLASGEVRESLKNSGPEILGSSLGQMGYDFINTTTNMLPSIGVSYLSNAIVPGSGAFVGAALMGGSAAGNSYQEKLNAGWDKKQARIYSSIVGVSEACLQYALGGIGSLGGKLTGKSAQAIAKGIDNAALRFAATYGMKMTSEGLEESLQEVLNPFFENLALGYQKNDLSDIDWEQVAYSGMLGALSAGFLEGGSTAIDVFSENSSAKEIGPNLRKGGHTSRILEIASLSKEGSKTHELYSQYMKKGINAENISDLQLGRLFVNAEMDAKGTLSQRKIKPEQEKSARATLIELNSIRNKTYTPVEARTIDKASKQTAPTTLEQAAREVVESRNEESGKMNARTLDALTANNQPITAEEVKEVTRLGENGSKLIAEIANEDGITFSQAEAKVKGAYLEGLTNSENNGENISDPQQKMAFNAGRQDRILQDAQRQAEAKNATVYDGTFHENEYTKNFTKSDKKMISIFAKALKMDIDAVDKIIANTDTGAEANARHIDGKLTISNNRDAKAVVYRMVLHESGHRMSQFATKEWGALMNALYQRAEQSGRKANLGVNNVSMFDMVKNQHDEAGISMETLDYIEEVAVRELENIFSSAEEFNKWYAEISANSELKSNFQKLCEWISKVIEDIKKAWSQRKMTAEEKAIARENLAELERIRGLLAETLKASEMVAQERVNEIQNKSSNTLENQAKNEYNEVVSHSLKKKTPYNEYNTIGMQWAYSFSTEIGDRKVLYKPSIKKFVLVEATKEDVGFIELVFGTQEQMREEKEYYEREEQTQNRTDGDKETVDKVLRDFEPGQNHNTGDNVDVGNRGTGIQNAKVSEGKPQSNGAADTQTTDGNLEGVAENSTTTKASANYSLSSSKRARLEKTILDLGSANIKKVAGDKEIRILTDQFSVNKAIYSKKGRTDREVNARIKAIPEFETIIRQSIYSYTDTDIVGLDSVAKKNVIAMHYFEAVYNGFNVEVVIRDKGKKQFLYEVKFIENKKNSQQSMPTDADSPAPKGDVENDISIPQNSKSVKSDFSLKNTDLSTKDTKELLDIIEHLKNEFEVTKFAKADRKKLAKMTKGLLKEYSSQADYDETFNSIDKLYQYIANGEDGHPAVWDEVYKRANAIAENLVEKAVVIDDGMYVEYKHLRDYLRKTPMKFNSKYDDVPSNYENFQEFRRRNWGRLNFTKDGAGVDGIYQELAELYPEFFNTEEQATIDAMLERIVDVLDKLQPTEINPYSSDFKQTVLYLANDIIERFFDIPQAKPTFADKAERRVVEERIRGGKKLEAVRQQKDEKIQKLVESQREKAKKQLAKLRDQKNKKVKEEQQKRRDAISRMSESQKAKVLRAQITRHANDLGRKLVRPTDNQHIPEDLKGVVATLLESINLEGNYTYNSESHSYKKNDEGLPTRRTQAFNELKKLYGEIASSVVVDPDLLGDNGLLSDVISLADKRIADMNSTELQTVWNTLRAIEASVNTANKIFSQGKFETILEFAEALREDNAGKKEKTEFKGVLGKGKKLTTLDMLTPETYFHYLGEAGDSVFRMMRDAQDKHISIMNEVADFTRKALKGVDVNSLEKTLHTVKLGGEDVQLTTAQLMELYVLMKRDQAIDHILVGGILPDVTKGKGIKLNAKAEPIRNLSVEEITEALSNLTDEQKKIADELQKYVSTVLAEYGNEASMQVYNYEKFLEKNYWPIRTNKQEIASDVGKDTAVTTVANKGMAKGTKPHANTSVRISSIFDTFSSHSSDMATYAAWLGTSEDVNRIRNFVFWEDGLRKGTVKGILDTVHGMHGSEYLQKLLTDISIGIKGTDNMNPFDKLIGSYKAASVGANIRVIIQQPTAILRALDMIDARYLTAGTVRPLKGWEKAKKYAPIAQWKDWGHFDINTGRQMKDVLFDNASLLEKAKQVGMWGASMADSLAWGQLWNAVELETKAKHKELEVGSEEYYKAVAKRFTEIVDHTQVVDGIMQRSQIMRSSDALTKMATSFMGEPTKQYNMAISAAYDAMNGKGDARKKAIDRLGRTAMSLVVAGIINACAQSLIDALRDDDKEKDYWEKWLAAFIGDGEKTNLINSNLGDIVNPFNYAPFAKDIVSIMQGYDVKRMDAEAITKTFNAITNMYKAVAGTGKYTIAEASAQLFAETARLYGIPVANVKRDIKSIVMSVANGTDSYLMQYRMEKGMLNINYAGNRKNFIDILFKAYNNDRKAYEFIYNDLIKSGYDAETIQTGMNSRLMKSEGVEKTSDLSKRYMAPDTEKKYDSSLKKIKSSGVWKSANANQRKDVQNDLYSYLTSTSEEMIKTRAEAKKYGVDETEYILWQLAKEIVNDDKESMNAKEKAAAIKMLDFDNSELAFFYGTETSDKAFAEGVDIENYAMFKAEVNGLKGDGKKDKVIAYANQYADNTKEYLFFMGSEYSSYKKRSDYIKYFGKE